MDIATHALASLALARGVFPGKRWPVVAGIVCAGMLADVDVATALIGPGAYFAGRRTFTHSIIGTAMVVALSILLTRYLSRKQAPPLGALIVPLGAASLLHVGFDLLQSDGDALLWPLRSARFAADCLPGLDVWTLLVLIAGICIPELLRLVTSEIGVKDKRPRGRKGAVFALALILVYVGTRAILHADAVGSLEPHTYQGESARKVGAYPDPISVFTWHGVVETQSLLCQVEVPTGSSKGFDPESATCLHKPESSPAISAITTPDFKGYPNARNAVALKYLWITPFPRAIVTRTQDGYEVVIRSMRDLAESETRYRVAAQVTLDGRFGIVDERFVWVDDIHLR